MPDAMPRGAVFLSYSRDDVPAVRELVRGLRAAQVPIWVDKQRLVAGANYRRSLEFEVKHQCSFFLSVISGATESDASRTPAELCQHFFITGATGAHRNQPQTQG
jgi:hypothetical protein